MLLQVIRGLRCAASRQVGRGGAKGEGIGLQRPGDQAGAFQFAETDRHVKTAVDQVHALIAHHHVQVDKWVALGKLTQGRHQAFGAEHGGRGDAQAAFGGFAVDLLGQQLGVGHQPQHFQAALIILPAKFGEVLFARGAFEQADAKPLFQRSQMVAHHGGRNPAFLRGGGHAAGLDDFHVHRHCLEQIHYQALV